MATESSPKRNRGKESNDSLLFGVRHRKKLTEGFIDLNDLLTKGYPLNASLELVGNHKRLNKRQRMALQRACASKQEVKRIRKNLVSVEYLKGRTIYIDGFNLLILMESALSGAYIFKCADGTYKDLSSVHGTYKRVSQTHKALECIAQKLHELETGEIIWVLDQPVSNSGKLKAIIQETGTALNLNWKVLLHKNPDAYIADQNDIAVSSDSWILERVKWFHLGVILINELEQVELFKFE